MPYNIHKQGNMWVVTKQGTGEVKSKHPSKEAAMKHMRALYATMDKDEGPMMKKKDMMMGKK